MGCGRALWVGVLVKVYVDGDKIGAPTEGDEDPFDTPELRELRADIEARERRMGISLGPDTLHNLPAERNAFATRFRATIIVPRPSPVPAAW